MINDTQPNWSAVIGRSLAFLCLKNSHHADSSLLEQAQFLEKLGLPIEDRAAVIGSTAASIRELGRVAKLKKTKAKNTKPKGRK